MKLFIEDFYKGHVAVNDIGYVSFKSPYYVLDMAGISSEVSRAAVWGLKDDGPNRQWMDKLLEQKDITLAIIYDDWYGKYIPPHWYKVGMLETRIPTIVTKPTVSFYATTKQEAEKVKKLLQEFSKNTHEDTRVVLTY